MFLFLFIIIRPPTNDTVSPAKSSFAASGFVIMVEVWLVCYLFVSVTKLPKKKQPCKKTYALIWSPLPNACVKKTKRRNHPFGCLGVPVSSAISSDVTFTSGS